MAHVQLTDITFRYPVYALTGRSLKVSLARQFAGGKLGMRAGQVEVEALRNVTLNLREGDRLGLVGRNGSGKSTLLRIVAGLAHPQVGQVDIKGKVLPLIERGIGINPELSGAANIELPMRFLGASTSEIREARDWVAEFTGLGNFIQLPVRTYSEGMKARLTFALSTAVRGDIIVLDEWLSAGDIDFVERAETHLTGLVRSAAILVFASHSPAMLRRVCNQIAWMDGGNLVMVGDPESVITAYESHMTQAFALAAE